MYCIAFYWIGALLYCIKLYHYTVFIVFYLHEGRSFTGRVCNKFIGEVEEVSPHVYMGAGHPPNGDRERDLKKRTRVKEDF